MKTRTDRGCSATGARLGLPMRHPVLFLAALSAPVALMTWAAATGRPKWMVAGWLFTILAFLCLPLFNRPRKPPR